MKIWVAVFFMACVSAPAVAQEKSQENQLETMKTKLNLSSTQYAAIKKIMEEAKASRKANETKFSTDKKALMEANKALRKSTDEKIVGQLDAKQKTLFEQMKAEHKENHGEQSIQKKIEDKMTMYSANLGLSSDQSTKIRAILTEYMTKIQSAKEQYKDDEEAAKAKVEPLRKEMKAKISALLTEAQKVKLKEMQKQGRD